MPLTVITSGSDIKLDDLATPDDNTDLNATTGHHGLLPKLSGTSTEYLNGSGAFSTPAGGGGTPTLADVLAEGADPDGTAIAGANGVTGDEGGDVILRGGSADANASLGSRIQATGADLTGGGPVELVGGDGAAGLTGGSIVISAGEGDDGNDPGASITIGGGSGAGNAGVVTITGEVLGSGSMTVRGAQQATEGGGYFTAGTGQSGTRGGNSFLAGGDAGTGLPGGNATLGAGYGDDGNSQAAEVTCNGGSGGGAAGTISITTGGLTFSVIGGTADPSAGGGVAADVASLYARNDSGTGELWVKTGSSDTAWTQVV